MNEVKNPLVREWLTSNAGQWVILSFGGPYEGKRPFVSGDMSPEDVAVLNDTPGRKPGAHLGLTPESGDFVVKDGGWAKV